MANNAVPGGGIIGGCDIFSSYDMRQRLCQLKNIELYKYFVNIMREIIFISQDYIIKPNINIR